MKYVALISLLFFAGCVRTPRVDFVEDEKNDEQVQPDPVQPASTEWSMTAPSNVVDAVKQVLGAKGSLPPKEPLVIAAKGVKVTVPAGSNCDYSMDSGSYVFVFNSPRPTVEASLGVFKVHPPLVSLRVNPDNTGSATVQTTLGKVTKKFAIRWDEDAGTGSPATDGKFEYKAGVVYFHTMPGCDPCEAGKNALEKAEKEGKLPFKWQATEWYPEWVEKNGFPAATWVVNGVVYTPSKSDGTPKVGWYGVDALISAWQSTQKK